MPVGCTLLAQALDDLEIDGEDDLILLEGAFVEQLCAALRRMTGLTAVLLNNIVQQQQDHAGSVLAALAQLPRLQRLYCLPYQRRLWQPLPPGPYSASLLSFGLPLPPGPYSACLRVLGTSIGCLNSSTALLASCSVLEHVAVVDGNCHEPGPFWQWAAQHRSLRRLDAPCEWTERVAPLYKRELIEPTQAVRLREARPQLEVQCIDFFSFRSLFQWRDPFYDGITLY